MVLQRLGQSFARLYGKGGLLVTDIDLPAATGVLAAPQIRVDSGCGGDRFWLILAIAPTRGKSAAWRCLLVRAG